MEKIHFQYTSVDKAISALIAEYGEQAQSVASLILSQVTMYQGAITEKWKYWDKVNKQLAARLDEDVLALHFTNESK